MEQWILYDFFKPDLDLSDEQLIAHRKRVNAERPTLAQVAGKILASFWDTAAALSVSRVRSAKVPAGTTRKYGKTSVQVKSIVRPGPDAKKLARTLWMLAEYLNEQQGSAPKSEFQAGDDQPRSRP